MEEATEIQKIVDLFSRASKPPYPSTVPLAMSGIKKCKIMFDNIPADEGETGRIEEATG